MSALPAGWVECRLRDIATQGQYGWTTKAASTGSVKYVRTTDITKGNINWQLVPYCQELPSDITIYQLREGDILISRAGSVGYSILLGDVPDEAVFASYLIRIRLNPSVNARYVARFLQSPSYWDQIAQAASGIALANVNAKKLAEVVLPLPPINEQQRIADKLDALLGRIAASRARLERVPGLLRRFRQAVLAAATAGELTAEWREEQAQSFDETTTRLGDTGATFAYGSSVKSSPAGDVPVLRMGNIQDGRLDWSDLVFTSDEEEIERYRLRNGDVLFNRTNSPELVGKTAVYHDEQPAIHASYLIRVRCGNNLHPDYLGYCLNSPAGRDYCWRVKSDGVSQSNINSKKLADFEFWCPSITEQREIVRRVEGLFGLAERAEASYAAAWGQVERLPGAVLARAFRGELG